MISSVSSSPISDVRAAALELAEEEQGSGLLCPWCKGGSSKERSLNVKKEKGYAYFNCHRSSCGKRGRVVVGWEDAGRLTTPEAPRTKRALETLAQLPQVIERQLRERYGYDGVDLARLEAQWSSSMSRMAMPIRGIDRKLSGYVMRTLKKDVKPKALTVLEDFDRPAQAWYRNWNHGAKRIIILEDQLSACLATGAATSVALLGTNWELSGVLEIHKQEPEHVVLCLDRDALAKALALHKRWEGMFKRLTVASPPKDLKDMPKKDMLEWVNSRFESSGV